MSVNEQPPRWAEKLLELLLRADAREGIVGDLREEYVEAMLPQRGRLRANLWYIRHVMSFVPAFFGESRAMGTALIYVSVFTLSCMCWLAFMETVLQHSGYTTRMAIDLAFALACAMTLFLRMLRVQTISSERCLRGAAFLMIVFGVVTFSENAHSRHFEGHAFLISLVLVLQGILMLFTLGRRGAGRQMHSTH